MLPTTNLYFALFISILTLIAYISSLFPFIAPWVGFAIAGYSVIANDSIQTLGTFLSSQRKLPWQQTWFFAGSIMLFTFMYAIYTNYGDLAFGRLQSIPESKELPFTLLAAPIILLVLTRFSVPVSTTFLLLSAFTQSAVIQQMLTKTLLGYSLAFFSALVLWWTVHYFCTSFLEKQYHFARWQFLQFLSTAWLWSVWIMHDMANVVVYLPRTLTPLMMVIVLGYLFLILGLLMYFRGGSIQHIVREKTGTKDVRGATMIDFIFALILLLFKEVNHFPMSTTWVFLGLLAGREVALNWTGHADSAYVWLIVKDLIRAFVGLIISFVIAYFV